MLERELGKSHHAYMSAEDSINDEVAAIHALSHLDEASQYGSCRNSSKPCSAKT